uniref:3-deoxy-D-manno-octulosonic acid transferase n=1 Tax=Candidatus Kentrum sp. LPFa TaxID=2126335 RepID=A0A450XEJ0_9GAMM|nr:MAG: Protein of unknown function (DUF3800) [Candidatus Kentron sp. LPFa]VFK27649.1 MAG: Protein of unknown function (DUF3800) [Candidatus Kentron sp. LPFa]
MSESFSDYIVYVDESGDHGLESIDSNYPVFVLAFCVFRKDAYQESVTPAIQQFKFRHFGHDMVILHETDIRKDRGAFGFLKTRELKEAFLGELSDIVAGAPFTLICTVIDKLALKWRYAYPDNPYHIALGYGLERVYRFLQSNEQDDGLTHVVVENRGKREDDELELEFRRIVAGSNYFARPLPFEIVFADKKSNSGGLQLADLVARPVGLSVLRPEQANRAFQVLEEKFYRDARGGKEGWGLKCFP